MLQTALGIAAQWAREVRIRWNMGPSKSAGMLFGRCRRGAGFEGGVFKLAGRTLVVVQWYRYLGVPVSCGGSAAQLVKQVRERALKKTRELAAWCAQRRITLDIAVRLWAMYVERSALFGASVAVLPQSHLAALDRVQRICGRLLMGHASRCPSPCVLAELGWVSWTAQLTLERTRLLARLAGSENVLTNLVLELDAGEARSWAAEVATAFSPWIVTGMPQTKGEWRQAYKMWGRDAPLLQADRHADAISAHQGLAHYVPVVFTYEGRWGINKCLYDHRVDYEEARVVSRLACGGQGCRAGDPKVLHEATPGNCCLHCLVVNGQAIPETLSHVLLRCPLGAVLREDPEVALLLRRGLKILQQHREVWSWRQLRVSRRFLGNVWNRRLRWMRSAGCSSNRAVLARAVAEWQKADDAQLE